jgi:hypothetical protein|tara:strand:+ start:3398 stop:4018 length:621 start_codon:yes stop_codon:yes gene_type:complete
MSNTRITEEALPHVFERPIPGQSLTNSPEQKYPWDNPPEITSQREATERVFLDLIKPDNIETVSTLMADGMPVADVAQMLLMTAFTKGKFNPDMMLNLLEPTMFMLLSIAEKIGLDPKITRDDDEFEIDDEETSSSNLQVANELKNSIGKSGGFKDVKMRKVSPTSVGNLNVKEQLESLNTAKLQESLLQRRKTKPTESLLEKPEV